ncbi:hypothetical protein I5F81_28675, partial [Pseudomonas aeruginosa]|nr:hypothetical protein [Pseudomonas aeruginosa]
RYLLAWAFATWVLYRVFKAIDLATRPSQRKPREDSVIARPGAGAPGGRGGGGGVRGGGGGSPRPPPPRLAALADPTTVGQLSRQ